MEAYCCLYTLNSNQTQLNGMYLSFLFCTSRTAQQARTCTTYGCSCPSHQLFGSAINSAVYSHSLLFAMLSDNDDEDHHFHIATTHHQVWLRFPLPYPWITKPWKRLYSFYYFHTSTWNCTSDLHTSLQMSGNSTSNQSCAWVRDEADFLFLHFIWAPRVAYQ